MLSLHEKLSIVLGPHYCVARAMTACNDKRYKLSFRKNYLAKMENRKSLGDS